MIKHRSLDKISSSTNILGKKILCVTTSPQEISGGSFGSSPTCECPFFSTFPGRWCTLQSVCLPLILLWDYWDPESQASAKNRDLPMRSASSVPGQTIAPSVLFLTDEVVLLSQSRFPFKMTDQDIILSHRSSSFNIALTAYSLSCWTTSVWNRTQTSIS